MEKIILYCKRIANNLERLGDDFFVFQEDFLLQDACCMCVIQIGELSAQLSVEIRQEYSFIPWRIIKDPRNFYVHAYGAIDVRYGIP